MCVAPRRNSSSSSNSSSSGFDTLLPAKACAISQNRSEILCVLCGLQVAWLRLGFDESRKALGSWSRFNGVDSRNRGEGVVIGRETANQHGRCAEKKGSEVESKLVVAKRLSDAVFKDSCDVGESGNRTVVDLERTGPALNDRNRAIARGEQNEPNTSSILSLRGDELIDDHGRGRSGRRRRSCFAGCAENRENIIVRESGVAFHSLHEDDRATVHNGATVVIAQKVGHDVFVEHKARHSQAPVSFGAMTQQLEPELTWKRCVGRGSREKQSGGWRAERSIQQNSEVLSRKEKGNRWNELGKQIRGKRVGRVFDMNRREGISGRHATPLIFRQSRNRNGSRCDFDRRWLR